MGRNPHRHSDLVVVPPFSDSEATCRFAPSSERAVFQVSVVPPTLTTPFSEIVYSRHNAESLKLVAALGRNASNLDHLPVAHPAH